MEGKKTSVTQELFAHMAEVEGEAAQVLPVDVRGFFVRASNDRLDITAAICLAYPSTHGPVAWVVLRLMREVVRFHLLFVSGNYDLLNSRLRFVWEAVFRAYLSENYIPSGPNPLPAPGGSLDEQVAWLAEHGKKLNWSNCIEPVLRRVHPLAEADEQVRRYYHNVWNRLHRDVHPADYLTTDLDGEVDATSLFEFDEPHALESFWLARDVFDLVWLCVLCRYPMVFDGIRKLSAAYPTLDLVLQHGHQPA